MRSRIVIVVVALILGGAAAVFAARYLNSARARVEAESQPVEVLVAQQDIPRGAVAEELFEKKLVAIEEVPRQFVAAGAVSSPRSIQGQVLAVSLSSGEQLTTSRFQFPSQAGLAYNVPENYVAVSVPIDDVSGVSGLVRPGDHVAILSTLERDEGSEKTSITKIIIRKARVLAVGGSVGVETPEAEAQDQQGMLASSGSGSGANPTQQTVTLALSPSDAEKVVFCSSEGKSGGARNVWLALLPTTSTGVPATSGHTLKTALR